MLKPNNRGSLDLIDDETGELLETDIWKTPWNHDTNTESDRVALTCTDKSLTIQSAKEDTDINNILERFMKSGEPPPFALPEHFGNYEDVHNQFEARTRIAETNAIFYKLDANLRSEFQNDPARWEETVVATAMAGDRKRLRELGIAEPEPLEQAIQPGVATPPPQTPEKAPTGAKTETNPK
ncbi:internal scaffolding protein [Blackfly microvirus SF02]|uniref:Internal scaffolding protein n=1 Tax=Blackfly microvirus SF02 TaxID=2576452 RepID=A0A4P8PKL0_9VIRU|nr:internal scaffolding protein [Blackfly microvirus SF02]